MRKRFALVADESGNAKEPLRVLAGVSGPARSLATLERSLRAVLHRHGLNEIKWAALRTRKLRLQAAREYLSLALAEAEMGRLGVDLVIFEERRASRRWDGLDEQQRWLSLYRRLIVAAKRRRPGAHWTLYPDQRTGMPWRRLGRVVESSSRRLALVQLADLLAGLARFSRELRPGAAPAALARRQELLADFMGMAGRMGLLKNGAVAFWQVRNFSGAKRYVKKRR